MEVSAQKKSPANSERPPHNVLIFGLGNMLMGDEGVGIHITQRMSMMHLDSYIKILDAGIDMSLLKYYLNDFDRIIFVDASMDGEIVGAVNHLIPDRVEDLEHLLTYHQDGFKGLLQEILSMENGPQVHAVSVSVSDVTPLTDQLSEAVEDSLNKAIWQIIDLSENLYMH